MTKPTPERSVEEFEQKFGLRFNNPDDVPLQGDVQDWLTQALQQQRTELLEAVRKGVPEKRDMQVAIDTGSDAGAGDTIGHNSCRQQLLDHLKTLDV